MVSHSQYICPDYLGPMSSNLDAGTSPLALLEKTCHSIGLPDPPKGKTTILPASDKGGAGSPTAKKESPGTSEKHSFKSSTEKRHHSSGEKSPVSSKASPSSKDSAEKLKSERSNSVGDANQGKTDENGNKTLSKDKGFLLRTAVRTPETKLPGSRPTSAPNDAARPPESASTTQAVPPTIPTMPHLNTRACFPPPFSTGFPTLPHFSPAASYAHGLSLSGFGSYPSIPSFPSPLNPFAGGTGLPRSIPCVDPTCKSCPSSLGLAAGLAGARNCPAGCTQCAVGHSGAAAAADLSAWLSYSSLLHGLPSTANPGALFPGFGTSLSSMTPPSLPTSISNGSSGGGGQLCGWVTGENPTVVCGKRFSSPEELLQHVQTHTKQDVSRQNSLLNLSSPPAGHPLSGRVSPRSLYLSSLQQRFHPYPKLSPTPTVPPHLPFAPPGYGVGGGYSAAALSAALCAGQRLPGSLPHV